MFVPGPGGPSAAQAGKKRREASIDRLKDRDPSERWKTLQKLWRPDVEAEAPSARPTSLVTPPYVPPTSLSAPPATSANPAAKTSADVTATTSSAAETAAEPASTESLWNIDEAANAEATAQKRTAERAAEVSYQAGNNAEEEAMQMDSIADARPKPITSILPYYDYTPSGENACEFLCPQPEGCPEDRLKKPCPALIELPDVPFEKRMFVDTQVNWVASDLFHNPLYFEDVGLERYGHTHGDLIQPFVSMGKFSAQLIGLPYQIALHPVHERRYALGYYRPGEFAPYKYYLPPWNAKAALTAGAVYTGLFYVFP